MSIIVITTDSELLFKLTVIKMYVIGWRCAVVVLLAVWWHSGVLNVCSMTYVCCVGLGRSYARHGRHWRRTRQTVVPRPSLVGVQVRFFSCLIHLLDSVCKVVNVSAVEIQHWEVVLNIWQQHQQSCVMRLLTLLSTSEQSHSTYQCVIFTAHLQTHLTSQPGVPHRQPQRCSGLMTCPLWEPSPTHPIILV